MMRKFQILSQLSDDPVEIKLDELPLLKLGVLEFGFE
jgi:hypothetical protein